MRVNDRHDMTVPVKVTLNPNTINQNEWTKQKKKKIGQNLYVTYPSMNICI